LAKIIVPKDLLEQLRKEIIKHGTAILTDEDWDEEIAVQPAGGFIEPGDDQKMQIVLEALREQDSDEPRLTSKQAREHLRRAREQ